MSYRIALTAFAVLASPLAVNAEDRIVAACSTTTDVPVLPGLTLTDFPAMEGDLPGVRVTDEASGDYLKVYYDPPSEQAARRRAACLGAQIGVLRHLLADVRRGTEWSSVVFAQPGYVPPRDGGPTRWVAEVRDGTLDTADETLVSVTLPHEQVHAFQSRAGARHQRWFLEGYASWIAASAAPVFRPDLAEVEARALSTALASATGPLTLKRWGFPSIRRSAVRRQVSPDLQARMDAEPDFWPEGAFSFNPEDFESDESNTKARYAAAAAVFEGLAKRHGAEAVQAWARDITAQEGGVSTADLVASIQARFGEDIGRLLD